MPVLKFWDGSTWATIGGGGGGVQTKTLVIESPLATDEFIMILMPADGILLSVNVFGEATGDCTGTIWDFDAAGDLTNNGTTYTAGAVAPATITDAVMPAGHLIGWKMLTCTVDAKLTVMMSYTY